VTSAHPPTAEEAQWARALKGLVCRSNVRLHVVRSPTHDPSQWLTSCAFAAQDALASEGVVPPDSDFDVATFAIIGKGDLAKSVERVKEYNEVVRAQYPHTPEEGLRAVGFLNRKWPGAMLAGAVDAAGRPMIVRDVNPYVPAQLEGEAEWRSRCGSMVRQPALKLCRAGDDPNRATRF
jgi:hypothetical protein